MMNVKQIQLMFEYNVLFEKFIQYFVPNFSVGFYVDKEVVIPKCPEYFTCYSKPVFDSIIGSLGYFEW